MNTNERSAVRTALIAQGFARTHYTQDFGDGIYSETWTRYEPSDRPGQRRIAASIVLQWGPKTPDKAVVRSDEDVAEYTRIERPTWVC